MKVWTWIKQVLGIALLLVVLWNEALYVSNESVTAAWDPSENATKYEAQAVWQGVSGDKQVFLLGQTTETQIVVSRPRTGAFEFQVRAGNAVGEWSAWSKSTDPAVAVVDGVARGWRIMFELPAPGGGGVS